MKYMKRFWDNPDWKEVNYEGALHTLLGTFKDTEWTRSLLTIGNYIPCRFSEIRVYDDEGNTAGRGEEFLTPDR